MNLVSTWGLSVLGALAVLILGGFCAKIIRAWARRALGKTKFEPTLIPSLSNLVYYGIWAFILIAVLGLFGIPTTGLRFFTVYGPWGRPDMAPSLFATAILAGEPIDVFNNGRMQRDFTYIDDISAGVVAILDVIPAPDSGFDPADPDPASSTAPYRLYNIGNHEPIALMDVISELGRALGKSTEKRMLPMQPGDVVSTYADISELREASGFQPNTPLEEGLAAFAAWFTGYYGS